MSPWRASRLLAATSRGFSTKLTDQYNPTKRYGAQARLRAVTRGDPPDREPRRRSCGERGARRDMTKPGAPGLLGRRADVHHYR
jgi:hypothetical protein